MQHDLALNPDWGNRAASVTVITVPEGTEVFEGVAGEQRMVHGGELLGGGDQLVLPKVEEERMIGTPERLRS